MKTYVEELLQITVNNDLKYNNNNEFHENKPPAPTRIGKNNSWSICQLSSCYTNLYSHRALVIRNGKTMHRGRAENRRCFDAEFGNR